MMDMSKTVTYAEHAERADDIAKQLERIAYRLRQGAIGDDLAATKLRDIADQLNNERG